jgi:hypothetical protein
LLCLFAGGFFAITPFPRARSVICWLAPCCQCVVMVPCLFLNPAEPSDFGCCPLAQEMSPVFCCLPYFRYQPITFLLSALLLFNHLFADSSHEDQLLPMPPFSSAAFPPPVLCVGFQFVYCSVCLGFFFVGGVSLPWGLCWFIPVVAGGKLHDAWHSPVWSAECLPSRFGANAGGSCSSPLLSV